MRLLIGNDLPEYLGHQSDINAWTQRVFWFAEENDVVILMGEPDYNFVGYVAKTKGVDFSYLKIITLCTENRVGNFDSSALLREEVTELLKKYASSITEVIALWPTPEVSILSQKLRPEKKLPSSMFSANGGGIFANSKALFRCIASGLGVSIPEGMVCRTKEEAIAASSLLYSKHKPIVVKQSYSGGGAGNAIIAITPLKTSHSGHAFFESVSENSEDVQYFWTKRWGWASFKGKYPVIVEEYVKNARTIYIEVICTDAGVSEGKIGELIFENGAITKEIYPAKQVDSSLTDKLKSSVMKIAEAYSLLGYRGRLSLDSVITEDKKIYFTEVNARFTGSSHLYQIIHEQLVSSSFKTNRIVVQATTPKMSKQFTFVDLLEKLRHTKKLYNTEDNTGIVMITPEIANSSQFVLCIVEKNLYLAEQQIESVFNMLR